MPQGDDDHRLRPHLRRQPVERKRTPAQAVDEAERQVVVAPGAAGGDAQQLRGIPAVGGAAGAIAGTNPASALIAKEARSRR